MGLETRVKKDMKLVLAILVVICASVLAGKCTTWSILGKQTTVTCPTGQLCAAYEISSGGTNRLTGMRQGRTMCQGRVLKREMRETDRDIRREISLPNDYLQQQRHWQRHHESGSLD